MTAAKKVPRRPGGGRRLFLKITTVIMTIFAAAAALIFITPTLLTITNSFMSQTEINANYGMVFGTGSDSRTFISERINLKFIPDIVTAQQYITAFIKAPDYLLKFWNSVILTVPIVIFQTAVAVFASYGFARLRGRLKEIVFFLYIVLMLMPYQVTLVPNYLVADKLGILNTRWSIILPGIFSPYAVFLLTKAMKRIPSTYFEAAMLDGAGEFRIFTEICFPMVRSAVFSVLILVFIDYWNMVEQPLIMLSDESMHPLSIFLSKINSGDTGLAFAVAAVYMAPSLLMFLYGEEYLVEGIAYSGGIKG